MKRGTWLLLLWVLSLSAPHAAEYRGKVGKLPATFTLDWKDDGSVEGAYHHPDRPGATYRLTGRNPEEGKLYLEEFSGTELTARCYLSKEVNAGVVSWVGEMKNLDGRTFALSFSRETGVAVLTAAKANHYFGNVGRKAAEYDLIWGKDGSVEGTYFYPGRPGIVYQLLGTNPAEGELYLAEYTGKDLTARCRLWKRIEAGEIVWEGAMKNLDGREFPMTLRRIRESPLEEEARVDDYEAGRRAVIAAIRREYRWESFPKADLVVDRVPIGLEGGQHFGARVTTFDQTAETMRLTFQIGDWDEKGDIRYEGGPEVTLMIAKSVPIDPAKVAGQEIAVLFDAGGDLFSVEFLEVAVTHVRDPGRGKLEIRGLIDLDDPGESFDWDPEKFRLKMLQAPVVELVPDKIALFHDPGFPDDEIFFQTLRLVRDYGISIQATDAGPGSLELESLSLDPEPNPWIELQSLKQKLQAPPSQHTGQAG